jgi:hypothetical protein
MSVLTDRSKKCHFSGYIRLTQIGETSVREIFMPDAREINASDAQSLEE